MDFRVFAYVAATCVATGILFGLAPALQASKADVVPVLKNELVPSAGGGRGLGGTRLARAALRTEARA